LGQHQLKEALAAFRQAFIADPADPEIAGQLGLTYLRLRRFKEAERLSVYALSLAPTQSATWLVLGEVYGQPGDAARAAGAFVNAYRFAKDPPQLTEQLAATGDGRPRQPLRPARCKPCSRHIRRPSANPVLPGPPPRSTGPAGPAATASRAPESQTTLRPPRPPASPGS
jgi:tetratricopeptide (TPR) repeat protein